MSQVVMKYAPTGKNIYQRIASVMEEVKYIQKTGYNSFHKYKYASEGDYINALRPSLLKNGLVVTASVAGSDMKDLSDSKLTNVAVKFTIVNIENPEEKVECVMTGSGADKGDKGVYKALTGAKKYFIGMNFLIETGDDAEADTSVDERAAKQKTAEPVKAENKPVTAAPSPQVQAPVSVAATKSGRPASFKAAGASKPAPKPNEF